MARLLRSPEFISDVENALRISEEHWGRDGRARYTLLLRHTLADLARDPRRIGVRAVPERPGLFGYHLRHNRKAVPAGQRVAQPRHVVYFRDDGDGEVVRLLRLLHDRMLPDPWLPTSNGAP